MTTELEDKPWRCDSTLRSLDSTLSNRRQGDVAALSNDALASALASSPGYSYQSSDLTLSSPLAFLKHGSIRVVCVGFRREKNKRKIMLAFKIKRNDMKNTAN
jgi:hypothetical protein